jgi:hypothetical protein
MAPRLRFGFPNMARMPSFLRPVAACAFAALAVAAIVVTSAVAQSGVTVLIQPPGGGDPVPIVPGEVADPDIKGQQYKIAKPSGGFRLVDVAEGVSLLKLLQETGTHVNYASVVLTRRDGTDLRLTRTQVENVGELVFYVGPDGKTYFIGPKGDDGVVAHRDHFEASPTTFVNQRAESKLKVAISPSKKQIEPGGTITFKASVTGQEPGETVTYKWWLNGKAPRAGESTHIQDFPDEDGVYEVSVSARVGDGASDTDVAKITVGDPDKADEEQLTSDADGSGTGGAGDGSSSYDPTYMPTPAVPATPAPAPPTPEPTEPPDIVTSGTPVEGNLLAAASDPPPSGLLESAAKAAREGKRANGSAAEGAGVPEAALSIAGVLALLGLGAGIESRQGRLPRLRLPRRAA